MVMVHLLKQDYIFFKRSWKIQVNLKNLFFFLFLIKMKQVEGWNKKLKSASFSGIL